MELEQALRSRRSIRNFKPEQLPEEVIRDLLGMAVWAPSGMNRQPWLFAVVQEGKLLQNISSESKAALLARAEKNEYLYHRYAGLLSDPAYDILHRAPTLILVYGNSQAATYRADCSMAAYSLMLAAWNRGIGCCWIGFASGTCNSAAMKARFGVPGDYELVAPIVLGYPSAEAPVSDRSQPPISAWIR